MDEGTLLIASATGLWRLTPSDHRRDLIVPLEADNPLTRSNEGRADPSGPVLDQHRGSYPYFRTVLRRRYHPPGVPNITAFAPDCSRAWFSDTPAGKIWPVWLKVEG